MRDQIESLTINREQLKSIPIQDRVKLSQSSLSSSIFGDMPPTEVAKLFPTYYQRTYDSVAELTQALSNPNRKPEVGGGGGGGGGGGWDGTGRTATPLVDNTPAWVKKLNKQMEGSDFLAPDGSGGATGQLIGRGEGGYGSFNRGIAGDSAGQEMDFSTMTVGQIMDAQKRGEYFAVGKYQIIPDTMSESIAALDIDKDTPFTPELQERIYRDYLIDEKRPAIKAYVTGQSDNVKGAVLDAAKEFASVQNPYTGRSHYDGTAGNSASISADSMANALEEERRKYQENISKGMDPDAAWMALSESNKMPEGTAKLELMQGLDDNIIKQYNKLSPHRQQEFLHKLYQAGDNVADINAWVKDNMGDRFAVQKGREDHLEGLRPDLVDVIKAASNDLPEGYRVEMFSGVAERDSGTQNHPNGLAMDVAIYDPEGRRLDNQNYGPDWKYYEMLARSMKIRGKEMYPDQEYIWGGAWNVSDTTPADAMHYQVVDRSVRGASTSSGAYSFETGLNKPFADQVAMSEEERAAYDKRIMANIEQEKENVKSKIAKTQKPDVTPIETPSVEPIVLSSDEKVSEVPKLATGGYINEIGNDNLDISKNGEPIAQINAGELEGLRKAGPDRMQVVPKAVDQSKELAKQYETNQDAEPEAAKEPTSQQPTTVDNNQQPVMARSRSSTISSNDVLMEMAQQIPRYQYTASMSRALGNDPEGNRSRWSHGILENSIV